ncbi:MAG: hypothetical protein M3507_10420 [Actinomycetota bacterium]|jgi:RNA polymerase primary sigma factor|nr:hypothetical protein [Actinomycetota bacterium]
MTTYLWPGDPGWPAPAVDTPAGSDRSYPNGEIDLDAQIDPDAEIDLDVVCLHTDRHLLDDLSPMERTVLRARFGLDGTPERSMKQLHAELGLTRHQVRDLLESGLVKLRHHLRA